MSQDQLICDQLKNSLSQEIKELYKYQLGHQLDEITFHVFEKTLVIIIEGTVTPPEQLLNHNSQQQLAQTVRTVLDRAIQPQIKALIEEVLGVRVIDFLTDTTIDTGRTGAIAIFELKANH